MLYYDSSLILGTTSVHLRSGNVAGFPCMRHQQKHLVFSPTCFASRGPRVRVPPRPPTIFFFNEIASMFSQLTTCYLGRGLGVRITSRPPLLPPNLSYDLCRIFDYRLPDISRSIRSNNRLGKPNHGDKQMKKKDRMRTSRHPGTVSKPEKNT